MKRRIGGHVSVAGGLKTGIEKAVAIGANTIQIFGSSPRQWDVRGHSEDNIKEFQKAARAYDIRPIFLHASYLINLASPDLLLRKKSAASLEAQLELANSISADGLIFHIGSASTKLGTNGKEMPRNEAIKIVAAILKRILKNVRGSADLIIENTAGGGQKIGSTLSEIGEIIRHVNSKRLKVCFDTAHAFEAGIIEEYTSGNIKHLAREFERHIGLYRLCAFHINDSKSAFNSHYDRHENLGRGYLGLKAFKNLLHEPAFSHVPWILEVPGFDGEGPDKKNINIVYSLLRT